MPVHTVKPPIRRARQTGGFVPAWWCRGRHAQTIWRTFFDTPPPLPLRRERWETPDDDFLDLDFLDPAPGAQEAAAPTVLFLHGLEGSSRSKYILGMLSTVRRAGWRGVALNFRSCSGVLNRQPRFYHSGETADLDWVARRLTARHPESPFFVVGFSLGGNALLKWLGEQGRALPPRLLAAVAVSVPFDLGIAAHRIDRGFGRLYGTAFLKTLKEKAIAKERRYPGLIDPEAVRRIRSYLQFDDQVTAPIHGFRDAHDYWRRCSAKHFLSAIRLPTLILHAEDDPFLPAPDLPTEAWAQSKWLTADITAGGGHAGFVTGHLPWRPAYWTEPRTIGFLSAFTGAPSSPFDRRRGMP